MSRAATGAVLATLAAGVPFAGCGSSSTSVTTSSSATTSATTASNPATSETVTSPSTSTKATTGTIPSNNGAATAFLPAYFFAAPDGSLSPRTIAAPAATAILFTVTSRATHPLTIAVAGHSLSVPTHGHLSARLAGLKPARYPVTVDGTPRAAIVVGVQPGP